MARKAPQAGPGVPSDSALAVEKPLNDNQKLFCREYARHGNGTLAYHVAYPEAGLRTCQQGACDLLKKPVVRDFVAVCQEERSQELKITKEDLLRVFATIAFNPYHKQQREAAHDLWEKLGFDKAASKDNWFDGFERITELIREVKDSK